MDAPEALQVEQLAATRDPTRGDAVGNPDGHADAKWAAVVADRLIPMPRRRLRARDIQTQAGVKNGTLVRDLNDPHDTPIVPDVEVDLAEGNVFRVMLDCETDAVESRVHGQPKLAFVLDDAWEITIQADQTRDSLLGLFDLPEDAEILRDFESPRDERILDGTVVRFKDGPVFRSRITSITVKVNNRPVRFTKRRVTGLEIKQAAIAQGVPIDLQFVLYQMTPSGDLGPVIRDHQSVLLRKCDQFRCIAPDDNSQVVS